MRSTTLAPAPHGLLPIPGDYGAPVLGYLRQYVRDPLGLWRRRFERYGPVSWFGALGARNVLLLGPDACGVALANRDKAFANGPGWRPLIGPFFDRGLMLLDFDEHLAHRRIMQQAFTNARLDGYTRALNPLVADALADWQPAAGFRVYPALKQLTLELATRIFMGGAEHTGAAELAGVNAAFIDSVQASTSFVRANVPGGRWHRGLAGRRVLERFVRGYLPARRSSGGDDLLSALCRASDPDGGGSFSEASEFTEFSDADIVNHMIFLLMAAHDTSTITLSTMIGYLGQHQDWQDACRDESLALGEDTDFARLAELSTMDMVMKEALRLVSPVPSLARMTVADTEVLGHFIPAGTRTSVGALFTHHDERYWPDPERFDPGRFAPDRREDKVHRYAWEPFGGGAHKCIGMHFAGAEVKTVLHHVLRRFRWRVDPAYRTPLDYTALPYPTDGQPVELRALCRPGARG